MPKALIGQGDASAGKGACPRGNNLNSMTWKERVDSAHCPMTSSCMQ